MLLFTVKNELSYFIWREIEGADRACGIKKKTYWSSVQYYQSILSNNQIINIIVSAYEINRDESIYVPIFSILKGEMIQKIPQHVQSVPRVSLPSLLLYHNKNYQLATDFIFVNGHISLDTMSINIKLFSNLNMQ